MPIHCIDLFSLQKKICISLEGHILIQIRHRQSQTTLDVWQCARVNGLAHNLRTYKWFWIFPRQFSTVISTPRRRRSRTRLITTSAWPWTLPKDSSSRLSNRSKLSPSMTSQLSLTGKILTDIYFLSPENLKSFLSRFPVKLHHMFFSQVAPARNSG